jgi:hypothetical protein
VNGFIARGGLVGIGNLVVTSGLGPFPQPAPPPPKPKPKPKTQSSSGGGGGFGDDFCDWRGTFDQVPSISWPFKPKIAAPLVPYKKPDEVVPATEVVSKENVYLFILGKGIGPNLQTRIDAFTAKAKERGFSINVLRSTEFDADDQATVEIRSNAQKKDLSAIWSEAALAPVIAAATMATQAAIGATVAATEAAKAATEAASAAKEAAKAAHIVAETTAQVAKVVAQVQAQALTQAPARAPTQAPALAPQRVRVPIDVVIPTIETGVSWPVVGMLVLTAVAVGIVLGSAASRPQAPPPPPPAPRPRPGSYPRKARRPAR